MLRPRSRLTSQESDKIYVHIYHEVRQIMHSTDKNHLRLDDFPTPKCKTLSKSHFLGDFMCW